MKIVGIWGWIFDANIWRTPSLNIQFFCYYFRRISFLWRPHLRFWASTPPLLLQPDDHDDWFLGLRRSCFVSFFPLKCSPTTAPKRGNTHLRVSMYVCTRTSMNGSRRLKMSQMSIIFSNSAEFTLGANYIFTLTYDVLGRLFDTFMNMVVSTSIAGEKKSINLGLKGVCLLGWQSPPPQRRTAWRSWWRDQSRSAGRLGGTPLESSQEVSFQMWWKFSGPWHSSTWFRWSNTSGHSTGSVPQVQGIQEDQVQETQASLCLHPTSWSWNRSGHQMGTTSCHSHRRSQCCRDDLYWSSFPILCM